MLRNTIIAREPRRVAIAGLLIATLLGSSAPLLSASELPKARVRVSDLDLTTPKGQHELERRLEVAIGHLCAAPAARLPPLPIASTALTRAGLRHGPTHSGNCRPTGYRYWSRPAATESGPMQSQTRAPVSWPGILLLEQNDPVLVALLVHPVVLLPQPQPLGGQRHQLGILSSSALAACRYSSRRRTHSI